MSFNAWTPEAVRAVREAIHPFSMTGLKQRHYRTVVMDTPDRRIRKVGYEGRRRPSIAFNVDPNLRTIVPNTTTLCMKSTRQLANRVEMEDVYDRQDVPGSYARLDEKYAGQPSQIFERAGITDPANEIVDLAYGDIGRHYGELQVYMNASGYQATREDFLYASKKGNDKSGLARVVIAMCLDSVEVLATLIDGSVTVLDRLAQVELENVNKVCPFENKTAVLTDKWATDTHIDGAFAEVHDSWQTAMTRMGIFYVPSEESKTSYILRVTDEYERGERTPLLNFEQPKLVGFQIPELVGFAAESVAATPQRVRLRA